MERRLNRFIDLSNCTRLFRGHMRDVYAHPDFDDVLIKVIRPGRADASGDFIPWRRKRISVNRTFGIYISYYREMREAIRAARNVYPQVDYRFPVAAVLGLAQTSLGMGLVVEKVTAPDGSPAPTLRQLAKEGRITARHRAAIAAFFAECAERHFVFGDLHPGNLVWTGDASSGRFICIDGAGEKSLVPIHQWFAWANRLKLRRAEARILSFLQKPRSAKKRKSVPAPSVSATG